MMKMSLKKETIAFCMFFFGMSTLIYSQEITGTVTDPGGVPLSGATIIEKGTTNGVQADFDGNYAITPSNGNAILVFSYIGFSSKEESASGRTTINVTLQEDVS